MSFSLRTFGAWVVLSKRIDDARFRLYLAKVRRFDVGRPVELPIVNAGVMVAGDDRRTLWLAIDVMNTATALVRLTSAI